ncbi:MAG: hypothetical protein J6386_17115 [Candidatus Synoicihabitans palmerolidicus]|nr:hypothetical protein [Candidatus Synoicihabitans palmerolidicus]
MPNPVSQFIDRLDSIYRHYTYFDRVKARLLAGFSTILIVFFPLTMWFVNGGDMLPPWSSEWR